MKTVSETKRVWFALREPACVPERKGPFSLPEAVAFAVELTDARPMAQVTVITIDDESEPLLDDMPEWLEVTDRRYRYRAQRHRESSLAAFSALSQCSDCPPIGYPTDKTRCSECPRRRPAISTVPGAKP